MKGQPGLLTIVLVSMLGVVALRLGARPPAIPFAPSRPAAETKAEGVAQAKQEGGAAEKAEKSEKAVPSPTALDPFVCLAPLRQFWAPHDLPPCGFPHPDNLPSSVKYKFLIATVADPADSRLGYQFDASVSAIANAVQATGEYRFDRYWLPWQLPGEKKIEVVDAELQVHQHEAARHFEQFPGVILFRGRQMSQGLPTKLLVLFIVGETPTAGVHKRALRTCLDLIACAPDTGSSETFRIVGPSFSGSAASLQSAIVEWRTAMRGRQDTFRLISGSATSVDQAAFTCLPGGGVSFQATVLPDRIVLRELFEELRQMLRKPKFAILTESNTDYGGRLADETAWDATDSGASEVIRLRFPLHVGQIRAAYDASLQAQGSTVSLDPLAPQVHVPQTENETARDVLPLLSPGMTRVSIDQELAQLLSSINRERVNAVGVFATDIRDKIFLSEMVKRYCPHVVLFTTDTDVLLASRDHRRALRGMICASTYPLYARNQLWSYAFEGERQRSFLSQHADYGLHNAVLAQLCRDDLLLEYGPPQFTAKDFGVRIPPVWISVIGDGGFWPLNYRRVCGTADPDAGCAASGVGSAKDHEYTYVRRASKSAEPAPLSAIHHVTCSRLAYPFSYLVGLGVAAALVAFVARTRGMTFADRRLTSPVPPLAAETISRRSLTRRYVASSLLLLAGLVWLSSYCWYVWSLPGWVPGMHGRLALAAAGFLALTAIGAGLAMFVAARPLAKDAAPSAAWGAAVGGVVFIVLCLAWFVPSRTGYQLLSFERIMQLDGGLSPLVSALLVAIGVVALGVSELRTVLALRAWTVPAPFSNAGRLEAKASNLWQALLSPWLPVRGTGGVLIAVEFFALVLLLVLWWLAPRVSYESLFLSGMVVGCFVVLLALAFAKLLGLCRLAWSLNELAHAIGQLPLTAAFRRLPETLSKRYGDFFRARRVDDAALDAAVHQWNHLFQAGWPRAPLSGPGVAAIGRTAADEAEVAASLSAYAAYCLRKLSTDVWSTRPLDKLFPSLEAKEPLRPPSDLARWQPVEDFVALQIVLFLSQFFCELRRQATLLVTVPVLLLVATTIYPFAPRELLVRLLSGLIIVVVIVLVAMIMKINANPVFSHIAGTKPYQLTTDSSFLIALFSYLSPLVLLVLTQFDALINWVWNWLQVF